MVLQRGLPGWRVVADHSAPGTMLVTLGAGFAASERVARYVVIENGVIDAWRGVPLDWFLSRYGRMVEQIRSEGRVPVLTGFSRQTLGGVLRLEAIARRDIYDAAIKRFASESNVAFADWGAVAFEGASDLTDFVHPRRSYSDRLVAQLAQTLGALAPDCVEAKGSTSGS